MEGYLTSYEIVLLERGGNVYRGERNKTGSFLDSSI